jgi:hypothetical protein
MTAISKVVSLLAISVALTLSGSHVFAKTGGSNGPGQVKTSGTSASHSGNQAGGPVVRRPKGCGHHTTGACAFPTPPGATGGGDPINRGPGHPTLHPK